MTDTVGPDIKVVVDKSAHLSVHYLEPIRISIGIENLSSTATLVIDSISLRFQSRRARPDPTTADPYTTVLRPIEALSMSPRTLAYRTIEVRPSLHCLTYTNYFDVVVGYRVCAGAIGEPQSFIGEGWFAIVNPAPQLFGKVFISYKEPEDRSLADLLLQFARDVGFDPYLAPADLKTGSRIWGKKIPAAIKQSKFMFVIWTGNTSAGHGVKREINIARKNKIEIVPLLERKTPDPKLFGRDVEYTEFDSDKAALTFADVVIARRRMIEEPCV
jgi:TIR domain